MLFAKEPYFKRTAIPFILLLLGILLFGQMNPAHADVLAVTADGTIDLEYGSTKVIDSDSDGTCGSFDERADLLDFSAYSIPNTSSATDDSWAFSFVLDSVTNLNNANPSTWIIPIDVGADNASTFNFNSGSWNRRFSAHADYFIGCYNTGTASVECQLWQTSPTKSCVASSGTCGITGGLSVGVATVGPRRQIEVIINGTNSSIPADLRQNSTLRTSVISGGPNDGDTIFDAAASSTSGSFCSGDVTVTGATTAAYCAETGRPTDGTNTNTRQCLSNQPRTTTTQLNGPTSCSTGGHQVTLNGTPDTSTSGEAYTLLSEAAYGGPYQGGDTAQSDFNGESAAFSIHDGTTQTGYSGTNFTHMHLSNDMYFLYVNVGNSISPTQFDAFGRSGGGADKANLYIPIDVPGVTSNSGVTYNASRGEPETANAPASRDVNFEGWDVDCVVELIWHDQAKLYCYSGGSWGSGVDFTLSQGTNVATLHGPTTPPLDSQNKLYFGRATGSYEFAIPWTELGYADWTAGTTTTNPTCSGTCSPGTNPVRVGAYTTADSNTGGFNNWDVGDQGPGLGQGCSGLACHERIGDECGDSDATTQTTSTGETDNSPYSGKTSGTSDLSSSDRCSGDADTIASYFQLQVNATLNACVTPVTLSYINSQVTEEGVAIRWSTSTETGNVGFNVFASADSSTPLNPAILLSPEGSTLNTTDYEINLPQSLATFFLEDVSITGQTVRHGPYQVGEQYGERRTVEEIDWAAISAEHTQKSAEQNDTALQQISDQQAQRATSIHLAQLRIPASGVYQLDYSDLLALGLDLSGMATNQLAITHQGVPVPRTVTGGATVNPATTITFVGNHTETLYRATTSYQLWQDELKAREMLVEEGTPSGGSSADFYLHTLTVDDNVGFDATIPTADPWYHTRIASSTAQTRTFTLALSAVSTAPTAPAATLAVDLIGGADFPTLSPDHHVKLLWEGNEVADTLFNGIVATTISADLPTIQNGDNQLALYFPADLGAMWEVINLDRFSLTYPRAFVAIDNALTFHSSADSFTVSGLSAPVSIYRKGDEGGEDGDVSQIHNAVMVGDSVQFAGHGTPSTYYVIGASAMPTPALSLARPVTDIFSGSADYLMISHPDFIAGLAPLVTYHTGRGLTVKVVNVLDIYDQFSGGEVSAEAIATYVRTVAPTMGLRYLLLVGGDSYDYKNHLGLNALSFLPSPYGATGTLINHAPLDPQYADLDGDGVADLMLGRFPVRTSAELTAVINKTLAYPTIADAGKAIFVADINDGNVSFSADSNAFATALPSYWQQSHLELDTMSVSEAKSSLIAAINNGVGLVSYIGHSSPTQWAWKGLFDKNDAAALTNVGKPTLVAQYGCWTTFYASPNFDTMGHKLLVSGEQGAAAVLGAATLTEAWSERLLGERLTPYLGQNLTVGEAILRAKKELSAEYPQALRDVQMGYVLLGDPAMPLPNVTVPTATTLTTQSQNDASLSFLLVLVAGLIGLSGVIIGRYKLRL